jgi:hypothetical protein
MSEKNLKFLRAATIVYIGIAALAWCFAFKAIFFPNKTFTGDLNYAGYLADTTYYLAVWLLAAIIVIKSKINTGNLLFACLMTANSISPTVPVILGGVPYTVAAVTNNLIFYTLLLKTFQYFPKRVTREAIQQKLGFRPIREIMLLAHRKKALYGFVIIALGLMFTDFLEVLFVVLLLVVMAYLYINLSTSGSDRNKVLWLFWGFDIYFLTVILGMLFLMFNTEDRQFAQDALSIIAVAALLLALTMSFFFFDSFDTGVIVKRTIINSFTLICIIFLYNVIEHYVLHWVSHQLHLSDVLVSSILSGILVMIFSPIHHRLMHFFEKRLKNGHQ